MRDVDLTLPNGLDVVSTFSGCGGSCLGYRLAGYRVLWANEFIPAAQQTYRANFPDTPLDERDIRDVLPEQILEAVGRARGDIDLLDGSPPCASFSSSGNLARTWGSVKAYSDTAQRVDDLFFEFVRILAGLQPRAFVAENVSGLVRGVAKGYFKEILRALVGAGYVVEARVLDSQWLGVPQRRRRLIFVGVRSDIGRAPVFPQPLPYRYSVRDVLPSVDHVRGGGEAYRFVSSDEPAPTIIQSGYLRGLTSAKSGGDWVREGFALRRFTIDELKLLSSFPADFVLTGSFEQQWERLGRAVPPVMMQRIAATLAREVLCDA